MGNYVFNPNTGRTELAADQNRPITVADSYTGQQGQSTITPGEPGGNLGGQVSDGPLASLSQNPYQQSRLSYPRDITSSQKSHSVRFVAVQVAPTDFSKMLSDFGTTLQAQLDDAQQKLDALKNQDAGTVAKETYDATEKKVVELSQSVVNFAKDPTGTLKSALGAFGTKFANAAEATSNFKPSSFFNTPTSNASDVITLYMPDNAESNYNARYNQIGLLEAAASVPILGAIPNAIQSFLQNSATKVVMQSMGYVYNPQEQVLFEGIDFRTFNMSFTLTPFSKSEADEIKNIIQTFRKNAAPKIATGGAGFFFIPPSIFEISFYYNGVENPNLNKIKRCVLTDVNVNFAPNGVWSTHDDGSPVQTALTLSFKEIELVDRTAIEAGY